MDKTEFESRVIACERKLYVIAYQYLRSNADCEDAVQEALMRAFAKRGALRNNDYFETWLTRILINELKRIYRARKSRAECAPDANLPAQDAPDREVQCAISALAPKYRLPLALKYEQGYTSNEIARILGVSATTVAWRLRRAKKLIEEALS